MAWFDFLLVLCLCVAAPPTTQEVQQRHVPRVS